MTNQKSLLIADDDPELIQALVHRCEALGLQVQTASDGPETMMLVAEQTPDLLILDITMPTVDGLSVCEQLVRDPKIPPLAVIMLTGSSDERTVQHCQSLGAYYVLKDSRTWAKLEPIISGLLGLETGPDGGAGRTPGAVAEPDRAPKVLVVDDDPAITEAICIRLEACGFETLRASNGMQGFWLTIKDGPDAIVTDYMMPEGSGERFLARLKESAATKDIPVIVLTGRNFNGGVDHGLRRDLVVRMGAAALFTKPYEFQDLLAELGRHIAIPASG